MAPIDVLAANNFGDTRSGSLAGPLGLLIIVLLVIGTVLLIRNMNKRLRRLPDRFPTAADGSSGPVPPPRGAAGRDATGPGAAGRDATGPGAAGRDAAPEPPAQP